MVPIALREIGSVVIQSIAPTDGLVARPLNPLRGTEVNMKALAIIGIIVLALALTACDVERTGENSVEISTDTAATAAAADSAATAADVIKEESKEAAAATESAARDAAQKTGTALEKAGKEIQEHSKPGNQP